jgi:catechol 2,3-dioxygenase-like lactoylglutathione lyase family enzyme
VSDFRPSRFEAELGRHVALAFPRPELADLRRRLLAGGATLIAPERPTPFERFFFRDPDGYVFEIVAAEREPEA